MTDPAFRVRLAMERTDDFTNGPWTELDSETLAVYDDKTDAGMGHIDAAKAARMFFEGVISEREGKTVRGYKENTR